MAEGDLMAGGCQCGRARYTVRVADDDAYFCHCRMCQRAGGGVAMAFRNVSKVDVVWAREPDIYRSSPVAERGFCNVCGTPLSFAFPDSDSMDLTIGSFDDPSRFVPRQHSGVEGRLDHWRDTAGLPGYRSDDSPSIVERWKNAVGKVPD